MNQRDIYGNGPVHLAVYSNSREVIDLLLASGANKDAKNLVSTILLCNSSQLNETPLDIAKRAGNEDIIAALGGEVPEAEVKAEVTKQGQEIIPDSHKCTASNPKVLMNVQ